jgi:hypothetical protein
MPGSPQKPASSDWLKVMIEEVARKREEAEMARREQELRAAERGAGLSEANAGGDSPARRAPSRPRRKAPR